ncbi:uncharacterized protein LOC123556619 isoform X2 [Mercenaria mercenaria]|uniref:uncharacterized protein LOC123556619 isoform X2 n=1 Tax=Mercenaria mercenaria TaxID=6596 RepID=UPI001E1D5AB9|nr:uncharacterized protein LOC123556619 isoform X2 [Mercenaria mercenaria]
MKPVLGMESGKAEIITVTGVPEKVSVDRTKGCTTKRIAVGVIGGVVVLTVVAAVVIVSVYFGSKVTSDSFKVAHQTYKTNDGEVVEEETNVTKTEVDIRVPNVAEIIYDYKHGLIVTRFVDSETNVQSVCLAQFMNETESPSTDTDKYTDGEVDFYEQKSDEDGESVKWTNTNKEVPRHMISENVARMCEGTKIYWMEKASGDGISKRQACSRIRRVIICYPTKYKCAYLCIFRYYCLPVGNLMATQTRWGCKKDCDPGPNNPICKK